jgi:hypothetical protein
MQNSNFVDPAVRAVNASCPVLAGYVAARFAPRLQWPDQPYSLGATKVKITNTSGLYTTKPGTAAPSDATVSLQVTQTDDASPSGVRSNLGAAVTIKPGGFTTLSFTPSQFYIEFWGANSTATGVVRIELETGIDYDVMSFDKSDTNYPQQLWAAQ